MLAHRLGGGGRPACSKCETGKGPHGHGFRKSSGYERSLNSPYSGGKPGGPQIWASLRQGGVQEAVPHLSELPCLRPRKLFDGCPAAEAIKPHAVDTDTCQIGFGEDVCGRRKDARSRPTSRAVKSYSGYVVSRGKPSRRLADQPAKVSTMP